MRLSKPGMPLNRELQGVRMEPKNLILNLILEVELVMVLEVLELVMVLELEVLELVMEVMELVMVLEVLEMVMVLEVRELVMVLERVVERQKKVGGCWAMSSSVVM
jgi:hypothetical protein